MGKKKATQAGTDTNSNGESESAIKLRPIKKQHVRLRIRGISTLITHNWNKKAIEMMREKHAGKKSKNRNVRDPDAEGRSALYLTEDGSYGVKLTAIKNALITAAHKDIGIEKTLVKKATFIVCDDANKILPLDCDEPVIQEDPVRVGMGSTDLRYRPYFHRWAVDITFEIDGELMQVEDLVNLLDRAGFGVGIGERRPEKGGEYGRFEVDRTYPVQTD